MAEENKIVDVERQHTCKKYSAIIYVGRKRKKREKRKRKKVTEREREKKIREKRERERKTERERESMTHCYVTTALHISSVSYHSLNFSFIIQHFDFSFV